MASYNRHAYNDFPTRMASLSTTKKSYLDDMSFDMYVHKDDLCDLMLLFRFRKKIRYCRHDIVIVGFSKWSNLLEFMTNSPLGVHTQYMLFSHWFFSCTLIKIFFICFDRVSVEGFGPNLLENLQGAFPLVEHRVPSGDSRLFFHLWDVCYHYYTRIWFYSFEIALFRVYTCVPSYLWC